MTPAPRPRRVLGDPGPRITADPTEAAGPDKQATSGRSLAAWLEPMLALDDVAKMLAVSRRWLERERAAGRVPKPDFMAGRCPRWRAATIRRWVEGGGRP
jgi:predicted DNA-binding transcriptional regulator AlpA